MAMKMYRVIVVLVLLLAQVLPLSILPAAHASTLGGMSISASSSDHKMGVNARLRYWFSPGGELPTSFKGDWQSAGAPMPFTLPANELQSIVPKALQSLRKPSALWLELEIGTLNGGKLKDFPKPREDPANQMVWTQDPKRKTVFWLDLSKVEPWNYGSFVAIRADHNGRETVWQVAFIRWTTSGTIQDEVGFYLEFIDPRRSLTPEALEILQKIPGAVAGDGSGLPGQPLEPTMAANPHTSGTVKVKIVKSEADQSRAEWYGKVQLINIDNQTRTVAVMADPATGIATIPASQGRYILAFGQGGFWGYPDKTPLVVVDGTAVVEKVAFQVTDPMTPTFKTVTQTVDKGWQLLTQQVRGRLPELGRAPFLQMKKVSLEQIQTGVTKHRDRVVEAMRLFGRPAVTEELVTKTLSGKGVEKVRLSQLLARLKLLPAGWKAGDPLKVQAMSWYKPQTAAVHVTHDISLDIDADKGDVDPVIYAVKVGYHQFAWFADCSNLAYIATYYEKRTVVQVPQQGREAFPAMEIAALYGIAARQQGNLRVGGQVQGPQTSSSVTFNEVSKQTVNNGDVNVAGPTVNVPGRAPATLSVTSNVATSSAASGAGAGAAGGAAGAGAGDGTGAAAAGTTVTFTI